MARQIDYYFALYSPWSYLGHKALLEIVVKNKARLVYKPTPLVGLFAETGGQVLSQRHEVRQRYRWVELQRWRDKRGVPLKLQPKFWPYASTLADRCVLALNGIQHDPNTFVTLAYKACWEKDLNLADETIIASLLMASGLKAPEILAAANSPAVEAAYEQNKVDAAAAGVFGAPSYVLDGEVFWGQDRLDLLDEALSSGRKPYAPRP